MNRLVISPSPDVPMCAVWDSSSSTATHMPTVWTPVLSAPDLCSKVRARTATLALNDKPRGELVERILPVSYLEKSRRICRNASFFSPDA